MFFDKILLKTKLANRSLSLSVLQHSHPILLNWCADFLQDRVKIGQHKYTWNPIKAGVPQRPNLVPYSS
jgi:hypothetical protein